MKTEKIKNPDRGKKKDAQAKAKNARQDNLSNECFICRGKLSRARTNEYLKCTCCGHEERKSQSQEFMVNEALHIENSLKNDFLEKYKTTFLLKEASEKNFLLDVGCSSGKFLRLNSKNFKRSAGIEVTPACIRFCKKQGLEIYDDVSKIKKLPHLKNNFLSAITFWHSLEHIPVNSIGKTLSEISRLSGKKTAVLISVPNARSWLYTMMGENYAFFDRENHVHQFTSKSLSLLMKKYGFGIENKSYSLPYSSFAYHQSLLNIFNYHQNFVYYTLRREKDFKLSPGKRKLLMIYNLMLSIPVAPFTAIFTVADFLFRDSAAVINFSYRKKSD